MTDISQGESPRRLSLSELRRGRGTKTYGRASSTEGTSQKLGRKKIGKETQQE